MTERELIKSYVDKYPKAQLCDLLKLSVHAAFGAAHFNGTTEEALRELERELDIYESETASELSEDIGEYERINLRASYIRELGAKNLARLFCLSAEHDKKTGSAPMKLIRLSEMIEESKRFFPCDSEAADELLNAYSRGIYGAVGHSEVFRKEYAPSYRVLSKMYSRLIPVIHEAYLLSKSKSSVTIALDGPCGSGKTTAAQILSHILNASVISLDDFFLPFEKKTAERLSEVGGNTDRERFENEVVPFLMDPRPFTYKAYSCSNGTYSEKRIADTRFIIVEGVYSMHPQFRELYDIRVWTNVDKEIQKERLLKRDARLFDRFIKEWIPMEEKYFTAFSVKEGCHIILN